MPPNLHSSLIAIDADGVLLDYNPVFGIIWHKHFGEVITPKDSRAFWSTNYWGVEEPQRGHAFWDTFNTHGWQLMQALPGAVEACQRLVAAGYELVCVTSIADDRAPIRLANLKSLGFPIDRVIGAGAVPHDAPAPKKVAIETLGPAWFIDDEIRKLSGFEHPPGLALVDSGSLDSPNRGMKHDHLDVVVPSLAAFAHWLLKEKGGPAVTAA
jgi:FMN phosphatase YigB (HAD superfamily)